MVRKPSLDEHAVPGDYASRQYNHLIDLVKIKTVASRGRFLDVVTDSVDDISGSIGIAHDTTGAPP